VNAKDNEGKTALMHTTDPETALFLIQHGADVNAKDLKGNTPLSIAKDIPNNWMNSESQAEKIIKYLKEHGAKE
jgi:ankyrin repeat protein